ncbi:GST-like protein [Sphingobium sp. JAI105]|uniref:glutathione S-transferase family protein n=1 Tax=Sphingobium sp. JAI105 TaxID=2787715 RepID=UPI0018C9C98C|nr:glutathione binding-like protein [Sphingobium sp. JAI105]MBG6118495.1 GST-like protein [Sphingobium sp. JAI105]
MIDLYATGSPNAVKIFIALEEMGLEYELHLIDLIKGANFEPEFVTLSPTAKIPVIVDHDAIGGSKHTVFESGAILLYLAEKTGKFQPEDSLQRSDMLQWLMMQMSNVGPYFGQLVHFGRYAPDVTYGCSRYRTIVRNILDVVERRLEQTPFIAGQKYTIADMAFLPWLQPVDFFLGEGASADYPSMKAWIERLSARPAVAKGLQMAADIRAEMPAPSASAPPEKLDRLLGRGAFSRR